MKLPPPPRSLGAAPRRLFGGYGPLLALAVAFLLVVTLVPTIAREETVVAGSTTGSAADLTRQQPGLDAAALQATAPSPGAVAPASSGTAVAGDANRTARVDSAAPAKPTGGACANRPKQVKGDPYSPPCIAWAKNANNGGATHRGVTRDKIRIGFRIPVEDITDFQSTIADLAGDKAEQVPVATQEDFQRTIRNLVTYFERNFQFYGRSIELVQWKGKGSVFNEIVGAGQEAANADAIRAAKELELFADVSAFTQPYADALSRQQVLAIGALYMSRQWFSQRQPYAWSPFPDCTSLAETAADYLSKRVFGYPADHAGPAIAGKPRKIGVITPDNPEYQGCADRGIGLVEADGNTVTRYNYTLDLATLSDQANNIAAKLKNDQITTVVLFTDPILPLLLTSRLTQQDYFPEWVVTGVAQMDLDVLAQLYDANQWKHAFGFSMLGEQLPLGASYAYAAAKSVDPEHEPIFGVELFYSFIYQVALGIHMAGPNLTPQTFAEGLRAYPGGSGPDGTWAYPAGAYAPQRDAREIWWNPEGTSPYNRSAGTYVSDGKRYRPGQWPATPAAPAQLKALARDPATLREPT